MLKKSSLKDIPTIAFKAGDILFRENDPPGPVYLISEGEVEIYRQRKGKKKTLAIMGPQCVFGEMSMIDHRPRSATASARTDIVVYVLNTERFLARIETMDPFMRAIFRVVNDTVRQTTNWVTDND